MKLSIVIVNYRTPNLTLKCIESIYNSISDSLTVEIIIIDNNSQDNSKEIVISKFNQIIWVDNAVNEGFGRANNIGIIQSSYDSILLINSDVVVLPGTIEDCMTELQRDNNIGVLGCELLNKDGSKQKSLFPISSYIHLLNQNLIIDKFFRFKEPPNNAIMGSFMLFPRSVFDKVGLFDPHFFMYCEEIELCHRIIGAGYRVEQNVKVSVIHEHGASTKNKDWSIKQKYASNALLFYKVHGFWGYSLYHLLFFFNMVCNFVFMWFIDSKYRKAFWKMNKLVLSKFSVYITLPFIYTNKPRNTNKQLKIQQ